MELSIREAVPTDLPFVENLLDTALAPFYGGDHQAHARRIFSAHIGGGTDSIGFFSSEQRMFIGVSGGQPVGLVHVVGKRQGTYKISPLIVVNEYRGQKGVGSFLLKHAESYARDHGARQLYCTVAEQNKSALQFFLKQGFIVAGKSDSHYKIGITEVMLYKLLLTYEEEQALEKPHLSVSPAEPSHYDELRRILLSTLPAHFRSIDDNWVTSLFQGYERRHSADINQKFKLLFVVTDRPSGVLGIAGATPKKGEPIKVMPFIALSLPAFIALLLELPYLLRRYGRKLYIHLVPTAEQTIVLQQQGWKLDAALPAAYHKECVTQQWSLNIGEELSMRTMRVKQKYLDLITRGEKTLEVRVGYENIKTIQKGERIRLMTYNRAEIVKVNEVRRYATFVDMLEVEDPTRIVPGLSKERANILLREIYPQSREALGVIVLDISVETKPAFVKADNRASRDQQEPQDK